MHILLNIQIKKCASLIDQNLEKNIKGNNYLLKNPFAVQELVKKEFINLFLQKYEKSRFEPLTIDQDLGIRRKKNRRYECIDCFIACFSKQPQEMSNILNNCTIICPLSTYLYKEVCQQPRKDVYNKIEAS